MPSGVQGGEAVARPLPALTGIFWWFSQFPVIERCILSQSLSWDLGCTSPWNRIRTTGSEMTILPLHEVPSGGKSRLIPAHALGQQTAFALGIQKQQVFIRHHPLSRTGILSKSVQSPPPLAAISDVEQVIPAAPYQPLQLHQS